MNDYQLRRERWYKDPKNAAVLRKLNKERKKRGKQRIHAPSNIGVKRPLTPFFRFVYTPTFSVLPKAFVIGTCKHFVRPMSFPEKRLPPEHSGLLGLLVRQAQGGRPSLLPRKTNIPKPMKENTPNPLEKEVS